MAATPDAVTVRLVTDPPIEELFRLRLRPGDILVAKLRFRPVTREQFDHIEAELRKLVPGHEVVVLSEIDLEVLDPEASEEAEGPGGGP
jgi:hypothetical protein